jgi:hypothetical protein
MMILNNVGRDLGVFSGCLLPSDCVQNSSIALNVLQAAALRSPKHIIFIHAVKTMPVFV